MAEPMSGRVGVEQTSGIEAVLAEHEYMLQNSRGSICRCGFVPTVDGDSLKTQQDYHRAHVADRLAAAVREARAAELREAADDPSLRLSGHSGISITRLRDRADRIDVDAPEGGA